MNYIYLLYLSIGRFFHIFSGSRIVPFHFHIFRVKNGQNMWKPASSEFLNCCLSPKGFHGIQTTFVAERSALSAAAMDFVLALKVIELLGESPQHGPRGVQNHQPGWVRLGEDPKDLDRNNRKPPQGSWFWKHGTSTGNVLNGPLDGYYEHVDPLIPKSGNTLVLLLMFHFQNWHYGHLWATVVWIGPCAGTVRKTRRLGLFQKCMGKCMVS